MNTKIGSKTDIWTRLTGDPETFSMENRAFNYVGVVTFPILVFCFIFDICISQVLMSYVLFALLIIQATLYYFSRYRKMFNGGIIIYAVCSYSALITNYYSNSGILGPTLCLFFLTFQLLITITKPRLYGLWIFLHMAIAMSLLFSEYFYPHLVPYTYLSKVARYTDIAATYTIAIGFTFALTNYLRNYLTNQRMVAEERAKAISDQNIRIMEQNELLAQVNEEKNKLFSIISHDLKTPLDSIRGYLELLNEQAITEDEKSEIERELLDQTKYTSDLLLNLLYWAKAQMHGLTVNSGKVMLDEILEEVARNKTAIAAKKGVKLSYHFSESAVVNADKDMMRIILRNVVNNAIKFTQPGGSVDISTMIRDNEVLIVVKDTGIGIPVERQDEVFTLKTASTYGTNNEKGIGLGLMICKEFIGYQDGRIWFESLPGKGSVFYIALPFAGCIKDERTGTVEKLVA